MDVLIPLARGFEEIECVSVVDILRRCGVRVLLAGVDGLGDYCGAHELSLLAECDLRELGEGENLAAVVLPGGWQGMLNLCKSAPLTRILQEFSRQGKLLAAICAAPLVLDAAGVLAGDFTCYPSCASSVRSTSARYVAAQVVIQEGLITASGPASAPWFALEVARKLGAEVEQVAEELLLPTLEARPTIVRA